MGEGFTRTLGTGTNHCHPLALQMRVEVCSVLATAFYLALVSSISTLKWAGSIKAVGQDSGKSLPFPMLRRELAASSETTREMELVCISW